MQSDSAHRPSFESVILDGNVLTQIRALSEEGEEDFLNSMIDMFLDRSPLLINDITTAIKEQNAVKLSRSSHALKGSCGNLGARKMAALCEKLEQLGYTKNITSATDTLTSLELVFDETKKQLHIWRV